MFESREIDYSKKEDQLADMQEKKNYYKETAEEQRETMRELEETIKALKKQDLETRTSIYNRLIDVSNIGHSNDINKNIKITDLIDEIIAEMFEDLKIELCNEEKAKIIELPNTNQSNK